MSDRTRHSHLTWKGTPKFAYPTEASALKAIPVAAPYQRMKEPTAYQCSECGLWHIGNESILPEWPLRKRGATIALAPGADREDER